MRSKRIAWLFYQHTQKLTFNQAYMKLNFHPTVSHVIYVTLFLTQKSKYNVGYTDS